MTEKSIVKRPSGRVKRVSQIARGPLNVRGKEPGYVYRIVNDIDDRIEAFKEGGYEVVVDKDVSIGERRVDQPAAEGSVKKKHVGNGVQGVLMRIRQDWYDEDQAAKAAQLAEAERAMKREVLDGYRGQGLAKERLE